MRPRATLAGPARSPEAVHRLVEEAINRADLDAFLDIHDEGANVVVPPDGRTACGRAEIGRAIAPPFELRPAMTSTVIKKLEAAQLALVQRRWHLILTEHGCRAEMSGLGTTVSRRRPDGTWRIVLDDPLTGP
jgi:ketosteroid isomerase-like protein